MKKCIVVLVAVLLCSCSSEKPFTARYVSASEVIVSYLGKDYRLNRFTQPKTVPFGFSFEADGGVDLQFGNDHYEVDSPYDRDKKSTKKKKKKTVKKKNTSSKK